MHSGQIKHNQKSILITLVYLYDPKIYEEYVSFSEKTLSNKINPATNRECIEIELQDDIKKI